MEIAQKRFSSKTKFEFGEEDFKFTIEDKSSSSDCTMNYADFPQTRTTFEQKNAWLRNAGLLWCVIGVLQIGNAIFNEAPAAGTGFWLLIGAGCLVGYRVARTKYSLFSDGRSNIFIIKDKKHDQILDEINKRKKQQLLLWYGDINFNADPDREIDKFRWLQKQGVITQIEAELKIAQIEQGNKKPASILSVQLN